jgi:hypothetical protein
MQLGISNIIEDDMQVDRAGSVVLQNIFSRESTSWLLGMIILS